MAGTINVVDGNPNFIYKTQIGSRLTGSVDISGSLFINDVSGGVYIASSSFLYSDGTYLRNIPRSALTEDALISVEIKSVNSKFFDLMLKLPSLYREKEMELRHLLMNLVQLPPSP